MPSLSRYALTVALFAAIFSLQDIVPLQPQALAADKTHRMPSREVLGANEDVAFITQLALIEGHVRVGAELYRLGEHETGISHVTHPIEEIYEAMRPALEKLGEPGFQPEIGKLSAAMQANADNAAVSGFAEKLSAITTGLRKRRANDARLAASLAATVQIVAIEYAEGVDGGHVVEDYDYQDAWGFASVARHMVDELGPEFRQAHSKDVSAIAEALAGMDVYWPDLMGRKPIAARVSDLEAVANHIQEIAHHLD